MSQMPEVSIGRTSLNVPAAIPLTKVSDHTVAAEPAPTVAILMTCFNRREKTLASLASLAEQQTQIPRHIHIILVDDGSKDGTAEAVARFFPEVEVLSGNGSLFWNGGMQMAFARARDLGFDYYLWLNDDTFLYPDCIDRMLKTAFELQAKGPPTIVAGSTCDPLTGKRTYGGVVRKWRWNGFHDLHVAPKEEAAVPCSTMNGNCTLVPSEIVKSIGILDSNFSQQFGDFDYGFRALRAGFHVAVAPGFIGTCTNNPVSGTWRDVELGFRSRWKCLFSAKGLPLRDWWTYSRRHTGYLWPLYFLWPYIHVPLSSAFHRRESSRKRLHAG